MIGTINAKLDRTVRDDTGNYIVSFKILNEHQSESTATIDAIRKALINGKPELTLEVHGIKHRRSMNANSYFWVLVNELAQKLNTPRNDIYARYIAEYGLFRDLQMSSNAVEMFKKVWHDRGIGWTAVVMAEANGMATVRAYYGSSCYSRQQMAVLIDRVVEDCKDLGIETKTPEELASLKKMWVPSGI